MRNRLLTCAAALELAALATAGAATAQTTTAPEGAQVTEIVVTAARRTERMVEVPASITVQTGEQLAASGVTNTREFTQLVTGLQFSNFGGYATPALRGIATQQATAGAENSVGIYIDGLYLTNQAVAGFDLPDIAQVEVLKGPQGTLYGRNATAGVIVITTQDPTDTPTGKMTLSYGRFRDFEARGYFAAPINDKLSFSVAGGYRDLNGWQYDIGKQKHVGAITSKIARAKLRFEPTDDASFTLTGFYGRRYDASSFNSTIRAGNTAARATAPNTIFATEPNTTALDFPAYVDAKMTGFSVRSVVDFEAGALTMVNGYTDAKIVLSTDADYTPAVGTSNFVIYPREKTWIHDISFASERFGAFSFLVGANYFDNNGRNAPLDVIGLSKTFGLVKAKAYGVFGEVTYHITDQLSVQAGVRYSDEEKSLFGSRTTGAASLTAVAAYPFLSKTKFNNTSPSLIVKYNAPELGNFYGSVIKGFKSGEYSTSSIGIDPTKPERITAYEVGFKSRSFDGFSFDIAAYNYDYKDIVVTVAQVGVSIIKNAAKAKSRGVDLNFNWNPSPAFTLRGGVGYLDAKYTDFPNAVANIPKYPNGTPGTTAAQVCPVGRYPCGSFTQTFPNFKGKHLPRAPEVTANLAATYRQDVGAGQIIYNTNAYYSSKFYWEVGNRVDERPYVVVNGKIGFKPSWDHDVTFSVWGRNLFDERYAQSANITTTADTNSYAPPRSYGVSIDAAF